jgi:chromosome segregation ATPase
MLSGRVRPNSEAAPWVIEEIKQLEAELYKVVAEKEAAEAEVIEWKRIAAAQAQLRADDMAAAEAKISDAIKVLVIKKDAIEALRAKVAELETELRTCGPNSEWAIGLQQKLAEKDVKVAKLKDALGRANKRAQYHKDNANAIYEDEQKLRAELVIVKAERDVYNSCKAEQDNGDGPCGVCRDCLKAKVAAMEKSLTEIHLCSQNSMSSKDECGRIAANCLREYREGRTG